MDNSFFSILLVVLGLLIGLFIAFVINSIRVSVASRKVTALMDHAKKEIEKMRRDAALEQKEEAHKLKNIYTDEQVQEFETKLNELSNMYWK